MFLSPSQNARIYAKILATLPYTASEMELEAPGSDSISIDNLRSWKLDYIHPPRRRPRRQLQGPYLYKIQLMQAKLVARRARIYPSFRPAIIGLFKPNARIG